MKRETTHYLKSLSSKIQDKEDKKYVSWRGVYVKYGG